MPLTSPFSGTVEIESEMEAEAPFQPGYFRESHVRVRSAMRTTMAAIGRRYVLVDMDGSNPYFMPDVNPGAVTWNHNEPDDFDFKVPLESDSALAVLDRPFREVQIWMGNRLLSWGPITRLSKSGMWLNCSGHDCLWYFKRRNIGRPGRQNYLTDGGFENGALGWTVMHASPEEPTAGMDPSNVSLILIGLNAGSPVVMGSWAARLSQDVGGGQPQFGAQLRQAIFFEPDASANPDGDVWTAAIYMQIDSMLDTEGMGLRIQRLSTTETVEITNVDGVTAIYPKTKEDSFAPVVDPPIGKWFRLETRIEQPVTGEEEIIYFSLIYPRGVSRVDEASLTRNERLEYNDENQETIMAALAFHLQDPTYGKTDLNIDITPVAWADVSTVRSREYEFSDYINGFSALKEFTELLDGADMKVMYTATTRTFTTASPGFGFRKPQFGMARVRNFDKYNWEWDGESAANLVVALGDGSGSAREEGWVYEGTHRRLMGGPFANSKDDLLLEEVVNAPPDTFVTQLDRIAKERYRLSKSPETITVEIKFDADDETASSMQFLAGVIVGDIVPVTTRHGALVIENGDYRIASITLNRDRSLSVVANFLSDDVAWYQDHPWNPHVD